MRLRGGTVVLVLQAPLLVLGAGEAQAYLDPGSVSYFFQMVAATVLGGLIALKLYWRRIWAGVRQRFSSRGKEDQA